MDNSVFFDVDVIADKAWDIDSRQLQSIRLHSSVFRYRKRQVCGELRQDRPFEVHTPIVRIVNSVSRGVLTGMSFSGEASELVLNAMSRGDTWGLKVFNFDLASTTAPYTLADFSNNVSETGLLSVLPDYAGATSAHGSLIEYSEGRISFTTGDFEAARAKRTPAYTNWVYSENSQFCPTLSYADGKFTSTPPVERLSEQYEPKLSTPINMSAGDTIVIDVGDD